MTAEGATPTVGAVLVVCTGNVARSPYLERRLRQLLDPTTVSVSSAGTGALAGQSMDAESAALLERCGADSSGFTARQLRAPMVEQADLVVCAAREHRAAVVQLHPRALRYAFTLGDLGDLARGVDLVMPALAAPGGTWVARIAAAAAAARGTVPPRNARDSDIVDPHGRGPAVYARMAAQIEHDLEALVRALAAGPDAGPLGP